MRNVLWAGSLALLSLFAVGTAAAADGHGNPLAEHVRAANDRFKDVSVALSEGYAPIPCASGLDGGAMHGAFGDMKLNVSCEHASMT